MKLREQMISESLAGYCDDSVVATRQAGSYFSQVRQRRVVYLILKLHNTYSMHLNPWSEYRGLP